MAGITKTYLDCTIKILFEICGPRSLPEVSWVGPKQKTETDLNTIDIKERKITMLVADCSLLDVYCSLAFL